MTSIWWMLVGSALTGGSLAIGYRLPPPRLREALIRQFRRQFVIDKPSTAIAPREPEPVYDTYGHPWPPIPELAAKLPRPPANYSWEITAELNDYGSPALRLSMLDLRTAEVGDFIERDLVVIRRWRYANDDTFASFYRRAAGDNRTDAVKRCRKVFYAHLLAPMADWAKTVAVSKSITEPPGLTTNYKLIEGSQ